MKKTAALLLYFTFCFCLNAQLPVPLGTAGNFAVLAGSTVTNTGATSLTGGLGLSPGTSITGFPPGTVNGAVHLADATAVQAKIDLTAAFIDAAGRLPSTLVAADITGAVIPPGVYHAASTLMITGNVTLNGPGVYIFQIPASLTTLSGSQVILAGGATAANTNIFWQVGISATLGTNSTFYGNILAGSSITVTTGASLFGRALAQTGAVTLDTNGVTSPGGPGPGAPPPPVPAPSSLILVATALLCAVLYQARKWLPTPFRNN